MKSGRAGWLVRELGGDGNQGGGGKTLRCARLGSAWLGLFEARNSLGSRPILPASWFGRNQPVSQPAGGVAAAAAAGATDSSHCGRARKRAHIKASLLASAHFMCVCVCIVIQRASRSRSPSPKAANNLVPIGLKWIAFELGPIVLAS